MKKIRYAYKTKSTNLIFSKKPMKYFYQTDIFSILFTFFALDFNPKIMERQKIQLNNKSVWPSEPYCPNPTMMPAFVGRENEMELIMTSWIGTWNKLFNV